MIMVKENRRLIWYFVHQIERTSGYSKIIVTKIQKFELSKTVTND